ncbi:hypothetical protein GF386_04220 [Candidatus Pacearchaeota archaeon]|nr:hypothetical protein [Candidatus Pacearchaeota archaeon]
MIDFNQHPSQTEPSSGYDGNKPDVSSANGGGGRNGSRNGSGRRLGVVLGAAYFGEPEGELGRPPTEDDMTKVYMALYKKSLRGNPGQQYCDIEEGW